MHLLLVHRYFAPDVAPYAQTLEIMARRFVADGHEVTVFTSQPAYNAVYEGPRLPRQERRDGFRVRRVRLLPERGRLRWLRLVNFVLFAAALALHLLRHRRRYALVTVTTIPPVIMGSAARLAGRVTGVPYLYHCMDLYPEVALVAGMLRPGPVARVLRRIDTANCRRAARVVVLSEDMRDTLIARGLDGANVAVLNNFILAEAPSTPPQPRFTVLFAGNMGRFQGLEDLIAVAHDLAFDPGIRFVFMGAGSEAEALQAAAGPLLGRTVTFEKHRPIDEAAAAMAAADLGVVSLRPGVYRVAFPSKTMMYLEAGTPMLTIVEPESDLARMVEEHGLGWVCPPGDRAAIAAAIIEARRREAGPDRARITAVGRKLFGQERLLDEWSDLVAGTARRP